MVRRNTSGQVTLFVIIGAIILLAAILLFFIIRSVSEDKPGIKEPEVSLEARPAMALIEGCLEQTAKEALFTIGKQGGALTTQPKLSMPSYRGESVEFSPYVVPFWRHLEDCANPSGCEASKQYPLCVAGSKDCVGVLSGANSIEEQLETYVASQVIACVDGFKDLSQVYDLELIDEPSVNVFFGSGQTTFVLSYPTKITSLSNNDIKLIDDYLVKFDVDLLGLYNFAEEIILFERTHNYYEQQTMNLIAAYSGIDKALPPIGEIELSANENMWIRPEVEQVLQYDLLPLMSLIQFANTANGRRMYVKEDLGEYTLFGQGVYDALVQKTSDTEYSYEVTHRYLFEPIFFSINDGGILIKPGNLLGDSLLVDIIGSIVGGIRDYRFRYQLSYPLVITIHDPEAFDGEGYDFQFAIEVNIRNNNPAYQNFSYQEFSSPISINLDDYSLRLPQEITIVTYDKRTGDPLENVIISYVCGNEYVIGQTELSGSTASLTTTLPYCELGGFIKYKKNDYLGESYPYDNREGNGNQYFELGLWPLQEKEVRMQRRSPADEQGLGALGTDAIFGYESMAQNLTVNQTVYFNIERLFGTPYDEEVPTIGFIQFRTAPPLPVDFTEQLAAVELAFAEGSINQSMYTQIVEGIESSAGLLTDYAVEIPDEYFLELAPGNYSIEAYLLDEGGMYVPNETIETTDTAWYEVWEGEWWSGEDTMDLPELNISTWPSGGAVFTFELTPGMLYMDRPIIFYVLEQPVPVTWTQLREYEDPLDYQIGKERLIQPLI